jgi:hypothetical protein
VNECKPLRQGRHAKGGVLQLEPIKPVLNVLGTKGLHLKPDELLSNVPFKLNLHRYDKAATKATTAATPAAATPAAPAAATPAPEAGAYTDPLFRST